MIQIYMKLQELKDLLRVYFNLKFLFNFLYFKMNSLYNDFSQKKELTIAQLLADIILNIIDFIKLLEIKNFIQEKINQLQRKQIVRKKKKLILFINF